MAACLDRVVDVAQQQSLMQALVLMRPAGVMVAVVYARVLAHVAAQPGQVLRRLVVTLYRLLDPLMSWPRGRLVVLWVLLYHLLAAAVRCACD